MSKYSEKTAICKPKREAWRKSKPDNLLISDCGNPYSEKIHIHCLMDNPSRLIELIELGREQGTDPWVNVLYVFKYFILKEEDYENGFLRKLLNKGQLILPDSFG